MKMSHMSLRPVANKQLHCRLVFVLFTVSGCFLCTRLQPLQACPGPWDRPTGKRGDNLLRRTSLLQEITRTRWVVTILRFFGFTLVLLYNTDVPSFCSALFLSSLIFISPTLYAQACNKDSYEKTNHVIKLSTCRALV